LILLARLQLSNQNLLVLLDKAQLLLGSLQLFLGSLQLLDSSD